MNKLNQPSELDWARLAAYIDGEGCISIGIARSPKWKRRHLFLRLSVHNTDPRLISWCRDTFEGKIYCTKHRNPNWSTAWSWIISCRKVEEILKGCLPFFIIKREQAETALAFQSITSRKWGVRGATQEVIEQQWAYKDALSTMKGQATRAKLRTSDVVASTSLIN